MPQWTCAELDRLAELAESQDYLLAFAPEPPGPGWVPVVEEIEGPRAWILSGAPLDGAELAPVSEGDAVWRWRRGVGLERLRASDGAVLERTLTAVFPLDALVDLRAGLEPAVSSAHAPRWLAGLLERARQRQASKGEPPPPRDAAPE